MEDGWPWVPWHFLDIRTNFGNNNYNIKSTVSRKMESRTEPKDGCTFTGFRCEKVFKVVPLQVSTKLQSWRDYVDFFFIIYVLWAFWLCVLLSVIRAYVHEREVELMISQFTLRFNKKSVKLNVTCTFLQS